MIRDHRSTYADDDPAKCGAFPSMARALLHFANCKDRGFQTADRFAFVSATNGALERLAKFGAVGA